MLESPLGHCFQTGTDAHHRGSHLWLATDGHFKPTTDMYCVPLTEPAPSVDGRDCPGGRSCCDGAITIQLTVLRSHKGGALTQTWRVEEGF